MTQSGPQSGLKHRLVGESNGGFASLISSQTVGDGSAVKMGASPRIVAPDRTAANDCLRDGLRASRAHGGLYTYDEFFPDFE
jgi:hypothetical protein